MASCAGRGSHVKLDKLSRQAYSTDGDAAQNSVTEALAAASQEVAAGKAELTVVASRDMVEMRTLSVPHMDADELPMVIRFQAQRQLANMTDNWTLDYVLLPPVPGQEMQTALVGAVAPEHIKMIESTCSGQGLQVKHIALRPIEIARFAVSHGLQASGSALVVSLSQGQADLLLLKNGQVVLLRGTKLPSEPEQLASALSGEVRRSMMAASSQLGSAQLESAMLIAPEALRAASEAAVSDACGTQLVCVDPATIVGDKVDNREQLILEGSGRLAAIAGAANLSPSDKKTSLDFKNPKKPAPKKKKTGLYVLAAAAALLVAVGGVSWWYHTNQMLDEDLAMYEAEVEGKEDPVNSARKKIAQFKEVEQFMDGSPNFLEILTYISEKMPESDKVLMGSPSFSTTSDGNTQLRALVAADSDRTLTEFGESLEDERYKVIFREPRLSERGDENYRWEATAIITVANNKWLADKPVNDGDSESGTEVEQVSGSDETSPAPDENKSASTQSPESDPAA